MKTDLPSIKKLIKNNQVHFNYYRAGNFYYDISCPIGDSYQDGCQNFRFPVPISEIGDATLKWQDKAIYFMRYINRAIKDGTFIKI